MQKLTSNLKLKRESNPGLRAELPSLQQEPPPVLIEYCVPGNYERVANSLAEAIEAELGETAQLLPSRDGVFEITVHGRLVFSKRACSRFPDREEIFYHLRNC